MTDPVSILRALRDPLTLAEAADLITMPGRAAPAPSKTAMLLLELGFEPRHSVEADGKIVNRWHPPAPLADYAFGPIDAKPRMVGSGFVLTVVVASLVVLSAGALAGFVG